MWPQYGAARPAGSAWADVIIRAPRSGAPAKDDACDRRDSLRRIVQPLCWRTETARLNDEWYPESFRTAPSLAALQ
jgi:hypothetical protein